ncbi:MAG: hypothetical protein RML72_01835 [Bacteroidia bacterium]|nr:hypothetical protein [Bacteroidia bacterium]MDW8157601.1 hypothetical protein [Bacteroidia bacterium]
MVKQPILYALLFCYCLGLKAQAGEERSIIITTLDSIELPCPNNKPPSHLQFSGDTAVFYLLANSATLYFYSLVRKTVADSMFLPMPISDFFPPNNFYYIGNCNLSQKGIPVYFKVTPNWIYTENDLGYALWSRNGVLLENGYFQAPRKGKAWYTAEPRASFYSALLGTYVYKPVVRARPRFEKRNSDKLAPFNFEKEYYAASNYTLACYRVLSNPCTSPRVKNSCRFLGRKARIFQRSLFDFLKHSYAYYLYHTHLAIDEVAAKLYIGFASEPQITVTDTAGNQLCTFGEKGKHIKENVLPCAVPKNLVEQIEKRPFYRKSIENQCLIYSLSQLERFSARYQTLFWDSYQKFLFRWYEFPTVSPYFQPPFIEGQYMKNYGLQVYDEKGKLLADEVVYSPFKFLCANSDGTYWVAARRGCKGAGSYMLFRIRLVIP